MSREPDKDSLADLLTHSPAMLFIADASAPGGVVLRRSEALARFLGPGAEVGAKLSASLHPDDLDGFQAAWSRLALGEAIVDLELRLLTEDGAHHEASMSAERSGTSAEIHGAFAASVSMILTEARRTERDLRDKIAMIERQQAVIRELATPIIEVWDNVLTLPMLGVVDSVRAAEVMENLLIHVSKKASRFVILDVTGVEAVDTSTAGHLLKVIQALKLLGAEGIITGIRPSVAQTMVALGVDMEQITTLARLRDGLRLCMKRLRDEKMAATAVATPKPSG